MKISHFWVVTKPNRLSTIEDIVFRSTPQEIGKQFIGGLKPENVVSFYDNEDSAMRAGELLIHKRDMEYRKQNTENP